MEHKKKAAMLMLGALVIGGLGAFVATASAEELYLYVDANGNVQQEMANTPSGAIATADNISLHSGVMLATQAAAAVPLRELADGQSETYLYVDMQGNLKTEMASTPAQAIDQASNRDPNSGVMLAD